MREWRSLSYVRTEKRIGDNGAFLTRMPHSGGFQIPRRLGEVGYTANIGSFLLVWPHPNPNGETHEPIRILDP